ncbi:MAG: hypothetical protein K2Y56_14390 [Methylobacterium sp.]|uniref:molybdopterin-binding protein n=1 Tax=Methylobacterium sp. TaxID=409 RepID=UPI0025DECD14|nr:molybdopterin-binding protein [Methylobacterium sp.]MBX9932709.1 hypothetical protein [Methylobacterium sp.]
MWTRDGEEPAAQAVRTSSQALMPLAEARARLVDGIAPVAGTIMSVQDAIGLYLGADSLVENDVPRADTALRDGWAVAAEAVTGASAHGPIYLRGTPAWLDAGTPLPSETDTILEPDAIPTRDGPANRIAVIAEAAEAEGVRREGAELRRGLVVAAAGTRLTPLQALALRACGLDKVAVRRPRIRLVVANAYAASSCAALAGLIAADGGSVVERAATGGAGAIGDALLEGEVEAVFVVGSTGQGRTDHAATALRCAGSLTAHGIALRPGETAGFGEAGGRPVLLIPGRPDAALAAYLALGRTLLQALANAQLEERPRAPLLRKLVSTLGVSEFVFARRSMAGLEPLGSFELPLHRLILADAAILVPPEREGYGEGTMVEIITW